ncbi:hypothetical protein A5482_015920 (plasmid) [Cyanobacterium sp. IPPAS B-1200]|uniref:hypothetical protein n=1 Tax=Cyanobacterium sp. IPPAS B-1200 TaxID=1562720 RepID=UPI0008528205|nr:hypothetical protein [Cyanobacterium sp. IPPAS B-1200]OEJ80016.1 hypothetical protein A5482_07725 [Cyanobacterium sp. IPPAS B-1200]
MTTITIPVAEEIKRAFESARPETQQQLSSFISLFFQYNLADKSLADVMAEISKNAQARGLTPEILADILAEDND